MNSSFTAYWNADRVRIIKGDRLVGRPVPFLFGGPHVSQPSFIRAGVCQGDTVYPIFVKGGAIHILARVVVGEILTVEAFVERRRDLYPPERRGSWMKETLDRAAEVCAGYRAFCWTCSDHVLLPERSTPLSVRTVLPSQSLERMVYRSQKRERPLKGVVDGKLTTIIGVQGVYRLADSSAQDFRDVSEETQTDSPHADLVLE